MEQKLKKACACLLTIGILSGTPTSVFAEEISHQPVSIEKNVNNEAEYMTVLKKWQNLNYLQGDEFGRLNAEKVITRAELIAFINRVKGYTETTDITRFQDIPSDAWYKDDIAKAVAAGYISGMSANEMAPEMMVTYEQALAIAQRLSILKHQKGPFDKQQRHPFQVSDWALTSVKQAEADGVYLPLEDNKNLTTPIPRYKTIVYFDRALLGNPVFVKPGVYELGTVNTVEIRGKDITLENGEIKENLIFKGNGEQKNIVLKNIKLAKDIRLPKGIKVEDPAKQGNVSAGSSSGRSPGGTSSKEPDKKDKLWKPRPLSELQQLDKSFSYSDGVYFGSGIGRFSDKPIQVKVTIKNGKITDIEKRDPNATIDDGGVYTKGFSKVIQEVKKNQNPRNLAGQLEEIFHGLEAAKKLAHEYSSTTSAGKAMTQALRELFHKDFKAIEDSYEVDGDVLPLITDTFRTYYKYDKVDVATGATQTARGTAKAIVNALDSANVQNDVFSIELLEEKQVKYNYTENDNLDLSNIKVRLYKKDNSYIDVAYKDFNAYGLKVINRETNEPVSNGMTLNEETIKHSLSYGFYLSIIHENSKQVAALQTIHIKPLRVTLTPVAIEIQAEDGVWIKPSGFNPADFNYKFHLTEEQEKTLLNKKIRFRLLVKDNTGKEDVVPLTNGIEKSFDYSSSNNKYFLSANPADLAKINKNAYLRYPNFNITLVTDASETEAEKFIAYKEQVTLKPGEALSEEHVRNAIKNLPANAKISYVWDKKDLQPGITYKLPVSISFSDNSSKTIELDVEMEASAAPLSVKAVLAEGKVDGQPVNINLLVQLNDSGKVIDSIEEDEEHSSVIPDELSEDFYTAFEGLAEKFQGKKSAQEIEAAYQDWSTSTDVSSKSKEFGQLIVKAVKKALADS